MVRGVHQMSLGLDSSRYSGTAAMKNSTTVKLEYRSRMRGGIEALRRQLDDVAIRIFYVRKQNARRMLATLDQRPAGRLDLLDGGIEVRDLRQTKAEVIHASVHTRHLSIVVVLIEGD